MRIASATLLLSLPLLGQAATVCVTDVASFQAALNAALGSNQPTFIKVARGTYFISQGLSFSTSAAGQGQIDIEGGYSSGDCSAQTKNPQLTVLDARGGTTPLGMLTMGSTGGISVRYLTFQNGTTSQYSTGGPNISVGDGTANAGVIFDYNVVRFNAGGAEGGFYLAINSSSAESGDIHFEGNLVYANTTLGSNGVSGAGRIYSNSSGSIYVVNNTFADNDLVANVGFAGGPWLSGGGTVSPATYVSNNIFWGNTKSDLDLDNNEQTVLVDNDYATLSNSFDASISGSLAVDPQFSSTQDFRLQATSPLLRAGTLTPTGGLPTIDVEGHPRSYENSVDFGAYERGDEIFGDGFD